MSWLFRSLSAVRAVLLTVDSATKSPAFSTTPSEPRANGRARQPSIMVSSPMQAGLSSSAGLAKCSGSTPSRTWLHSENKAAASTCRPSFRPSRSRFQQAGRCKCASLLGLRNELSELAVRWELPVDDEGLHALLRVARDPDDGWVAEPPEVMTFAGSAWPPTKRCAVTARFGWSGKIRRDDAPRATCCQARSRRAGAWSRLKMAAASSHACPHVN